LIDLITVRGHGMEKTHKDLGIRTQIKAQIFQEVT
jgi:hypothetical protein